MAVLFLRGQNERPVVQRHHDVVCARVVPARRVTVAGDVPVSISGEQSRVLSGDASEFANLNDLIS